MLSPHIPLDEVFDIESFESIEESLFAYITRAQFHQGDRRRAGKVAVVKSASTFPEFSQEPHDIVKELRILASLSHPNIVEVLGQYNDKSTCTLHYWMPFFPMKLRDLLDSVFFSPFSLAGDTEQEGPQRISFVAVAKSIVVQLISALAYLHDPLRQIAHRDVKPSNILLTHNGCVKLIDFGISWSGSVSSDPECMWPEQPGRLCFEVCTGPYRPPELLFGARDYDPLTIDLWSLGTTLAEFFTPLTLIDEGDDLDDSDDSSDLGSVIKAECPKPFIIPAGLEGHVGIPETKWTRAPLFDASRGSIGLAWSIFKIRGTPDSDNWPGFSSLPDASKVSFQVVPPVPLPTLLPNLPPDARLPQGEGNSSPMDLIHRFLAYPPDGRLRADEALGHPWFSLEPLPLLPEDYPHQYINSELPMTWEGGTLKSHLQSILRTQPRCITDTLASE